MIRSPATVAAHLQYSLIIYSGTVMDSRTGVNADQGSFVGGKCVFILKIDIHFSNCSENCFHCPLPVLRSFRTLTFQLRHRMVAFKVAYYILFLLSWVLNATKVTNVTLKVNSDAKSWGRVEPEFLSVTSK